MNATYDSMPALASGGGKPAQIVVILVLCLLVPACGKEERRSSDSTIAAPSATQPPAPTPAPSITQTAPTPTPTPPSAPVTSLGTLVRAAWVEQVDLQVLCVGGGTLHANNGAEVFQAAADVCSGKDKASKGKRYLVLYFEGRASRNLAKEFGKFVATSRSGFLARVDEQSSLEDGQGKKYKNGFAVSKKSTRQIAFEVPAQATGFTWHDGNQDYQISPEPTPSSKQTTVEVSKKLPQ